MSYQPIRVVEPLGYPVSLDEAKVHCHVDGADEDDYLTALIEAAVDHLDGYSGILGKCLMAQSWQQAFDCWQDFRLELGPVMELQEIAYIDGDGVDQLFDLSSVRLEHRVRDCFVCLKSGQSWPEADLAAGPIKVTWQAGYADADKVPAGVKHAIKLMIGHWFENREGVIVGVSTSELPMAVNALLAPHRRVM